MPGYHLPHFIISALGAFAPNIKRLRLHRKGRISMLISLKNAVKRYGSIIVDDLSRHKRQVYFSVDDFTADDILKENNGAFVPLPD